MQRVAQDLFAALGERSDIELIPQVLRTSWADTHKRVGPFLLQTYRTIARHARDESADVVLFSSMVTASLSVPLRKKLARAGIRTAAIVHGLDVTTAVAPYQWFVPRVFRALDRVLPISRATADACFARGLPRSKAVIVPNGINIRRFGLEAPAVDQGRDRQTLSRLAEAAGGDASALQKEDSLLLVSVGRQVKRKGFAWFVDAVMPRLPDNVHYWMAGVGPESDHIAEMINRHGLSGRVKQLGSVSDELLRALYAGGDLFVMPNVHVPGDMEGFGVVLLEAGLQGQPAIAAGIEGILDVVTPDANGVLVGSEDAAGFVDAIQRFNSGRGELLELSARARSHTIQTFSWPSVADKYVAELRTLTGP